MNIQVKFFASLREKLGIESTSIDTRTGITIREIWDQVTSEDYPVNTLCAINMDYAKPDDVVSDGDEVAFFPPVTGG
ncbi:MAG: molybdopterin converting factor subunit 1 [Gammaproteobacteria bacterium]|nr:molybdopterin converting factor subunit 1 [Gammaproteobacteria bacterium]MCK5262190.1 molybdopterin converting factor subunit 1 [Gammaproteobacteria bacterium]